MLPNFAQETRPPATRAKTRRLFGCHAGDCSFGDLISACFRTANRKIGGGKRLFVGPGAFGVPIFQADLGDRTISQKPYLRVLLSAIVVAVHNRPAECETLNESRFRGAVDKREYFLPIEDSEIDEVLVDKQLIRRGYHLIAAGVPD